VKIVFIVTLVLAIVVDALDIAGEVLVELGMVPNTYRLSDQSKFLTGHHHSVVHDLQRTSGNEQQASQDDNTLDHASIRP